VPFLYAQGAMAVTDEQRAAALAQFKQARIEAGLAPLIDDEQTLRMFAAVFASARRRRFAPLAKLVRRST